MIKKCLSCLFFIIFSLWLGVFASPQSSCSDALMGAINGGDSKKIVKKLLKKMLKAGADVNLQDENGITFLMKASELGRADIVKLLLKAGADVHLQAKDGRTALLFAIDAGQGGDIVKLLLEAGALEGFGDVSDILARFDLQAF